MLAAQDGAIAARLDASERAGPAGEPRAPLLEVRARMHREAQLLSERTNEQRQVCPTQRRRRRQQRRRRRRRRRQQQQQQLSVGRAGQAAAGWYERQLDALNVRHTDELYATLAGVARQAAAAGLPHHAAASLLVSGASAPGPGGGRGRVYGHCRCWFSASAFGCAGDNAEARVCWTQR